MNFNNSLELTQSQKLIITMQLKQSLNILNMSKLELEEEIKREYEENPLLEVEKSSEVDWEKYIKNIENSRPSYKNELYYNYDNDINLENIIKNKKQSEKERYVKLVSKLDTLSPLKTLTRGYSIIEQKGKIINSVKELQEGNEIDIQMIDGKAKAKII